MNDTFSHFSMKELPSSEQPYERCIKHGAGALTDAQLLSVIIKSGSKEASAIQLAQHLLAQSQCNQHGIGMLNYMQYPDLIRVKGIGPAKAVTILCVVELARRLSMSKKEKHIIFSDSETVAAYYMESMRHYQKEHFVMLLLDNKNVLMKELEISIGTINASLASPREVMIDVVRYEAVRFILLHNHPSGDSTPSRSDIEITKKIKQAGDILEISLLDHIVIGEHNYTSMRANGWI